ncbi:Putative regulatory protein, FmdB family (modular protein) [uncultured Desulfatiglans sp.]|uniref:Regulatory protein, FmdB family (Modular protein) n=1 Tax=Uncultured Desulfatiglans sp. TaxID=1748965 RepID=A0A653A155_UNCDX|nr:Putative regulatory protein, FmdB family (modular protein) [uncultured Desulfatiglans sp.]
MRADPLSLEICPHKGERNHEEGVLAMPIYEYECTQCGKKKEVWQKISDKPLTQCDSCNGRLRKLISQSTFHLKGSGWYVTDYASKSSSCTQSASTGATSSSTSGAEGTGESKPAQSCGSANDGGTAKDCSSSS